MNVVNFYVVEILDVPYYRFGKWFLEVKANSHGRVSEHTLMFTTKEKALEVNVGYEFLA